MFTQGEFEPLQVHCIYPLRSRQKLYGSTDFTYESYNSCLKHVAISKKQIQDNGKMNFRCEATPPFRDYKRNCEAEIEEESLHNAEKQRSLS